MVRAIVMAFMVLYKYLIFVSTTSNTLRAHTAASVTAYVHATTVEGATPSLESVAVRPVSRVTSVRMDAHLVSQAQTIAVHLVSQAQTIAVHLVSQTLTIGVHLVSQTLTIASHLVNDIEITP